MKKLLFIFCLTSCLTVAQAESLVFNEDVAASQIAMGWRIFQAREGREPKSWADIQSLYNRPLDEVNKSIQPTIRYAFLKEPLPCSNGKIVILSRSPAPDPYKMRGFFSPVKGSLSSSLIRYAIVVSPDGEVGSYRYSETQIQKMFADAGMALPDPDPLGPRLYEAGNRLALFLWIGFVSVFFAGAGYVVFPVLKKAVAWRPPPSP